MVRALTNILAALLVAKARCLEMRGLAVQAVLRDQRLALQRAIALVCWHILLAAAALKAVLDQRLLKGRRLRACS